jgi:hypothetical protein
MAEQSFPFENIDTTEDEFSQWASNFQDTGVQGSPTGTELKVTAEGSELIVNVALGQAFLRGHYYISTDTVALTVPSAGINTRIDYVVIELDPAANTIVAKLVSGTAVDENPVAPTLTQSATGVYQLPVALLTIPNSTLAITNEMLTDVRVFMANRVGIWTTATRPTDPTEYQTLGYNTTTGSHEVWNGYEWTGFMEPISEPGDLIIGDATGQAARLPIGPVATVLTSNGTALSWQDAGGGAIFYLATNAEPTRTTNNITAGATYNLNRLSGGSGSLTFYEVSASGARLATYAVSAGNDKFFTANTDTTHLIFSSSGITAPTWVSLSEMNTENQTAVVITVISTTQSVTLASSHTAYAIGAGACGASVINTYGGGGTYTATIGAGSVSINGTQGPSGGSTTIGAITALGGEGGYRGTNSSNATGGAGGSGGGSGRETYGSTGSGGGYDGGNGQGYFNHVGGAGSGVQVSSTPVSLVQAPGSNGGFYAGGKGNASGGRRGDDGSGFGGGGEAGWNYEGVYYGGTGANGVIYLIED